MALVFRSSTLGRVHISLWRDGARERDVEVLSAELQTLAGAVSERLLVLVVVEHGASLATSGARSATVQMLRELGDRLGGIALVIEGAGFGPAAMRSMFTGLGVLAQPGFPWKMFADATAASTWVLKQGGTDTPALKAVLGRVERLRAGQSS